DAGAQERYQTENVVIAVMDGTAWRATFGDPEHQPRSAGIAGRSNAVAPWPEGTRYSPAKADRSSPWLEISPTSD
ncbi:MAG: hypothetical protein L0210_14450, partial [Rhodospirillales bacterium]|nr:hypothetical protein [Rhodospirillales bacterium]